MSPATKNGSRIWIPPYVKANGVHVKGHWQKRPKGKPKPSAATPIKPKSISEISAGINAYHTGYDWAKSGNSLDDGLSVLVPEAKAPFKEGWYDAAKQKPDKYKVSVEHTAPSNQFGPANRDLGSAKDLGLKMVSSVGDPEVVDEADMHAVSEAEKVQKYSNVPVDRRYVVKSYVDEYTGQRVFLSDDPPARLSRRYQSPTVETNDKDSSPYPDPWTIDLEGNTYEGPVIDDDALYALQTWQGNPRDLRKSAKQILKGGVPDYSEARSLLDMVNQSPPVKMPLFRGTRYNPETMGSVMTGDDIDLPLVGFSSDPSVSDSFGRGVQFVIDDGAKAMFPNAYTGSYSNEEEYITGGRFKATKIEILDPVSFQDDEVRVSSPRYVVHLEQLGTFDPHTRKLVPVDVSKADSGGYREFPADEIFDAPVGSRGLEVVMEKRKVGDRVWVPAYTNKKGKRVKGHWKDMGPNIKRSDSKKLSAQQMSNVLGISGKGRKRTKQEKKSEKRQRQMDRELAQLFAMGIIKTDHPIYKVKRVRTAEGAKRYGLPIGAIIPPARLNQQMRRRAAIRGKSSEFFGALDRQLQDEGGFTVYPASERLAHQGIAVGIKPVSPYSFKLPANEVSADTIGNWMRDKGVSDELSRWNRAAGGWRDSNGDVYLDVVQLFDDKESAADAALGADQVSVFDLKNFEEIQVGGTGDVHSGMRSVLGNPVGVRRRNQRHSQRSMAITKRSTPFVIFDRTTIEAAVAAFTMPPGFDVLLTKRKREAGSGPNPKSSPKEVVGHHGHKPHGKSILWPALYEHLRGKGYSKEKAARISNAAWNKKYAGLPTNTPTSAKGIAKAARRVRTPEGARLFGKPIGSLITNDEWRSKKRQVKDNLRSASFRLNRTGSGPDYAYNSANRDANALDAERAARLNVRELVSREGAKVRELHAEHKVIDRENHSADEAQRRLDAIQAEMEINGVSLEVATRAVDRDFRIQRKGEPGIVGDGTEENPIVTDDPSEAAQLLAQGMFVRLEQPDQVSTLIDKLAEIAADAKAKGKEAPLYDLCKVSVPGTNLFCVESKGIPRSQMPQLSGKPLPGTPADKLPRNAFGEVDLGPEFIKDLNSHGVAVTKTKVPASHLKATQDQLNGVKVAKLTTAIEEGTMKPASIFVTKDGYIIDGHHRWAADVGMKYRTGEDVMMDVEQVNIGILDALKYANDFAERMGMPQMSVKKALCQFHQEDTMTPDEIAELLEKRTGFKGARPAGMPGSLHSGRVYVPAHVTRDGTRVKGYWRQARRGGYSEAGRDLNAPEGDLPMTQDERDERADAFRAFIELDPAEKKRRVMEAKEEALRTLPKKERRKRKRVGALPDVDLSYLAKQDELTKFWSPAARRAAAEARKRKSRGSTFQRAENKLKIDEIEAQADAERRRKKKGKKLSAKEKEQAYARRRAGGSALADELFKSRVYVKPSKRAKGHWRNAKTKSGGDEGKAKSKGSAKPSGGGKGKGQEFPPPPKPGKAPKLSSEDNKKLAKAWPAIRVALTNLSYGLVSEGSEKAERTQAVESLHAAEATDTGHHLSEGAVNLLVSHMDEFVDLMSPVLAAKGVVVKSDNQKEHTT